MSPICPTLLLLLAILPSALLAQTSDRVVTTVKEALETRLAAQTAYLETRLAAQTASLEDRLEGRLDAQTASIETRLAAQTASLAAQTVSLEDRLQDHLAAQTTALHEKIASLEFLLTAATRDIGDLVTTFQSASSQMAECCGRPVTTATPTVTPSTSPTTTPSTTPTTTETPTTTPATTENPTTTPTTTETPLPVVFLRRQDGSVDFYRDWAAYKSGFGNQAGEFWLGLDNLHTLTNRHNYSLRADLTDWSGETKWTEYSTFRVAGEGSGYRLSISGFNSHSAAGDGMKYHNGRRFSTRDRDNDVWSGNDGAGGSNCAFLCQGAWWYWSCGHVSPAGLYKPAGYRGPQGVFWYDAYGDLRSFKRVTLTLVNT